MCVGGWGGPEKGANQEIIHPQREGHDEMLMAKEQHAALDPNRLRRKSLEGLVTWGIVGRTICEKGGGREKRVT